METSINHKEYTCFFTGHRQLPTKRLDQIYDLLIQSIVTLIEEKGVTDFIAGGALGFDTMAAEAVIALREKYPFIKLHLYLPCYNQCKKWNYNDQYMYRIIMSKADDYIYVTEGRYTYDCMHKRNRRMADDSYYCICYCATDRSGTGVTVRYAEQKGIYIDNICETLYGI